MDVWILYDHVQYEGCSPPLGVYSTEAAAQEALKKNEAENDTYGLTYSITKLTMDAPPKT
jgi:hypothetical protein